MSRTDTTRAIVDHQSHYDSSSGYNRYLPHFVVSVQYLHRHLIKKHTLCQWLRCWHQTIKKKVIAVTIHPLGTMRDCTESPKERKRERLWFQYWYYRFHTPDTNCLNILKEQSLCLVLTKTNIRSINVWLFESFEKLLLRRLDRLEAATFFVRLIVLAVCAPSPKKKKFPGQWSKIKCWSINKTEEGRELFPPPSAVASIIYEPLSRPITAEKDSARRSFRVANPLIYISRVPLLRGRTSVVL